MTPALPAALTGLYIGAHAAPSAHGPRHVGTVRSFPNDGYVSLDFNPSGFGSYPIAETSLLLDSPLAMCHAARWLATRLGMEPGATAPGWGQYTCGEHCCNGETGEMADCSRQVWSLGTDEGFVLFMDCPNPEAWDGDERRHVPGISDLTDPAEALAAACRAVGGAL